MAAQALRYVSLPAAGATSWYSHYESMDFDLRRIDLRGVPLDSFAGNNDDAKLAAAMTYCKDLALPPPILLGAREHTFNQAITAYDGFSLIGAEGISTANQASSGTITTKVNVTTNGIWMTCNGGRSNGDQNWDMCFRNIAWVGTKDTQWIHSAERWVNNVKLGVVLWCMSLRDCSWTGFKGVLGSWDNKLFLTLCLFDGYLAFLDNYGCAVHIGGSDCSCFMGMTVFDSTPAHMAAGGASGQYHMYLNSMSKTTYGGMKFICEGGWGALRVVGAAMNSQSTPGGPNWITGSKFQGRSESVPCYGNLIRLEGGFTHLRDCYYGFAMSNPTTGHNGVITQTGGQSIISGATYDLATGVSKTTPLLSASGGETIINQVTRASTAVTWGSSRPVASGSAILIRDATTS